MLNDQKVSRRAFGLASIVSVICGASVQAAMPQMTAQMRAAILARYRMYRRRGLTIRGSITTRLSSAPVVFDDAMITAAGSLVRKTA